LLILTGSVFGGCIENGVRCERPEVKGGEGREIYTIGRCGLLQIREHGHVSNYRYMYKLFSIMPIHLFKKEKGGVLRGKWVGLWGLGFKVWGTGWCVGGREWIIQRVCGESLRRPTLREWRQTRGGRKSQ
jgi:hypothetical protein